jgi:hypothetical protein
MSLRRWSRLDLRDLWDAIELVACVLVFVAAALVFLGIVVYVLALLLG